MNASRHQGIKALSQRGFTLPQLLVAVGVLIIIIAATAKIFGTAGKVTGLGQASADVITEAAAVEQQLRQDIDRIHEEGFLAIRCVAVRNDVNGVVLLNPVLPPDAWIRADQLVFFTKGITRTQVFRLGAGSNRKGQSTEARVYWGPAWQLSEQGPAFSGNTAYDVDPNHPMFPWYSTVIEGTAPLGETTFVTGPGTNNFNWAATGPDVDATQPEARRWLLARQSVLFAHDGEPNVPLNDNERSVFLGNNLSAKSIFHPEIRNGRVDAASTGMGFIRSSIQFDQFNNPQPWAESPIDLSTIDTQREVIQQQLLTYPRGERIAPSMHRVDQALTSAVIGSACSDFRVDWTWDAGVGFHDPNGIPNDASIIDVDDDLFGMIYYDPETVWFGMPDASSAPGGVFPDPKTGVTMMADAAMWGIRYDLPQTVFWDNIESIYSPAPLVVLYEATFGYNRADPISPATGTPTFDQGYTPWPSALRITMTLHDPETKLEHGRKVQFVVRLPERTQ